MNNDYLIIHKSMLPDFYELVIRARDLIENEGYSVSSACQAVDISRSTFYKYKDYVFLPSKEFGRKAILAFRTFDTNGVLASILNVVYEKQCNVVAINQGISVKDNAYITLTLDLSQLTSDVEELVQTFKQLKYIKSVNVIAID